MHLPRNRRTCQCSQDLRTEHIESCVTITTSVRTRTPLHHVNPRCIVTHTAAQEWLSQLPAAPLQSDALLLLPLLPVLPCMQAVPGCTNPRMQECFRPQLHSSRASWRGLLADYPPWLKLRQNDNKRNDGGRGRRASVCAGVDFLGEKKKVWTGLSVQMRSLAQLQPVSCVTDTQRQRILVAFYSRPEWLRGSK